MKEYATMATPVAQPQSEMQWRLLILLVIAVFVNYIDRGNLSVSAAKITDELQLNPAMMGQLSSAFFWTYALCQVPAGWLIQRYDVHKVFAAGFLLWSLATAFTGLTTTFTTLFAFRLILGVGESVAYPAFSKIIAKDFPEDQRGKANGFIDAGSKLGPALGTLIGGLIVANLGWRSLFLILGFGALAWLPFWMRSAPKHRAENAVKAEPVAEPTTMDLLSRRAVWGSFLGLFAINYAWYFMVNWFPYYLEKQRGFSTQKMAVLGSLPFAMIAVSATLGGWLSDRLISKGHTPTLVRKSFIIAGLLTGTILYPAGIATDDNVSMGLFLLACFAFGFATSNHWAVTQTLAGPGAASKWTGFQNCFGNFAGVAAGWLTGRIVNETKSFDGAFLAVAGMVVMGALAYAFIIPELKPIDWGTKEKAA
ncbi:MAG: MFS transporter [Acidobacteriota bacterium]